MQSERVNINILDGCTWQMLLNSFHDCKKLLENFFSLLMLRGVQILAPIITIPHIMQVTGIDNFGKLNFAVSIANFFGAVILYGMNVTAAKKIAIKASEEETICWLYSLYFTLAVTLFLAGLSVNLILNIFVSENTFELYLFFVAFLAVGIQSLIPVWLFQGLSKLRFITIVSSIATILNAIFIVVFIDEPSDIVLVPMGQAFFMSMVLAISTLYLRLNLGIRYSYPGLRNVAKELKEGHHVFISQFASGMYLNFSVFVVGLLCPPAIVGAYSAAMRVIEAVSAICHVAANALLPYLAIERSRHLYASIFMCAFGLLLSSMMLLYSNVIADFLFDNHAEIVDTYLKLLSPSILLVFVSSAYGQCFLMIYGFERKAKQIILLVSIASVIVMMPTVWVFQAWGAALIIIFSRLLTSFLFVIEYKRVGIYDI